MEKKILNALQNMGNMNASTMQNAFHNQDDARIMLDRYQNKFNQNNIIFYENLCDIDQGKFDRFLRTLIIDE